MVTALLGLGLGYALGYVHARHRSRREYEDWYHG
jgi:hypothetical protein